VNGLVALNLQVQINT